MGRIYSIVLFTLTLTALCVLLALPALASESKAPIQLKATARPNTPLLTSLQITFTSASTFYLPIVIKPQNSFSITSLDYDSQDETITIKNNGPGSEPLNGWQIVSVVGTQIYNFPSNVTLAAGQSVRIHSGPAAFNNPPSDLLWSTSFLWNNLGDAAELRDNQGSVVASVCYLDGCP